MRLSQKESFFLIRQPDDTVQSSPGLTLETLMTHLKQMGYCPPVNIQVICHNNTKIKLHIL